MLVVFLLWDGIPEHSTLRLAGEKIDVQDKTMVQVVSANYPKAGLRCLVIFLAAEYKVIAGNLS